MKSGNFVLASLLVAQSIFNKRRKSQVISRASNATRMDNMLIITYKIMKANVKIDKICFSVIEPSIMDELSSRLEKTFSRMPWLSNGSIFSVGWNVNNVYLKHVNF